MTGPVQERRIGWRAAEVRPAGEGAEQTYDVGSLLRMIRRQLPLVVACAAIGMAIAVAMILGSVPRFRAVETVLLDEERSELLEQVSPVPNALRTNSAIESELEIIKSQALAMKVVERMGLHRDESFLFPPVGTTDQVASFLDSLADPLADLLTPEPQSPPPEPAAGAEPEAPADPETAAKERAVSILRGNLDVRRVGRSFVIEISYLGYNPVRARDIARAYGKSYRTFQLESTTQVAANAGEWIQERLEVLEAQSLEAAADVQRFRAENELVQVRGDLLTDQQQSEMASELIRASAQRAEVGAVLSNLESLLDEPPAEALSVATLPGLNGSREALQDLRQEYVATQRRYLTVAEEYGRDNSQAQELRNLLSALEDAIDEELRRAVNALRAEYEIALSREQSLREDLDAYTETEVSGDSAVLGRLAQLEAVADTYHAVYRDYLERYELTTQQQAFPIASVQIISPAETPGGASSPQKKLMLATGLFLGGLFGALLGAIMEMRPRRLRTRSEVEEELGLHCAGLAPRGAVAGQGNNRERAMLRTATRAKNAIDQAGTAGRGTVVGLAPVSTVGDGRSFILSLASVLSAGGGRNVLVVDAGGAPKRLDRSIRRLPNVHFLEAGRLSEFESAVAPPEEAEECNVRADYDYSLILLPGLTQELRVDPLTHLFDATVMTIPWGRVGLPLVRGALEDHREFRARLVTTVLDNANLRVARRYMQPGSYEERISHA